MEGLTPLDIKRIEREKALNFRSELDEVAHQEAQRSDGLFMGMTDNEILVNKAEFIKLGLM